VLNVPDVPALSFVGILQEVAFLELHVMVDELPEETIVGEEDTLTVGILPKLPSPVTVTTATPVPVPLSPLHVIEYEVVFVKAPVLNVPEVPALSFVGILQEVAFLELHVMVDELPEETEEGVAVTVTAGKVKLILIFVPPFVIGPPGAGATDSE